MFNQGGINNVYDSDHIGYNDPLHKQERIRAGPLIKYEGEYHESAPDESYHDQSFYGQGGRGGQWHEKSFPKSMGILDSGSKGNPIMGGPEFEFERHERGRPSNRSNRGGGRGRSAIRGNFLRPSSGILKKKPRGRGG